MSLAFEPPPDGVEAFPSFAPFFSPVPRWLELQHLPTPFGLLPVLRAALASTADADREVAALFAHRNHRCHLVGAGALLAGLDPARGLPGLWRALDAGSWAAPQLAAVALVLDPGFETQARTRLMSGAGPAKTAAALAALYPLVEGARVPVIARALEPSLRLSEAARDGAGYARQWLGKLLAAVGPADAARFVRRPDDTRRFP